MSEEPRSQLTRLPTEVENDSPFLVFGNFNMGLRQVLTIVFGLFIWFICVKVSGMVLPISGLILYIAWSWIILVSAFITFVKKDGEPYEEYITGKIQFLLSERSYGIVEDEDVTDEEQDMAAVEDQDWGDIDYY